MDLVKYKVKQKKDCIDGKHTFIPVAWKQSGDKKICTKLICRHCLTSADKQEQEIMEMEHNQKAREKQEKNQDGSGG